MWRNEIPSPTARGALCKKHPAAGAETPQKRKIRHGAQIRSANPLAKRLIWAERRSEIKRLKALSNTPRRFCYQPSLTKISAAMHHLQRPRISLGSNSNFQLFSLMITWHLIRLNYIPVFSTGQKQACLTYTLKWLSQSFGSISYICIKSNFCPWIKGVAKIFFF
jgi:hypothetical protein